MRDINKSNSLFFQHPHHFKKLIHFLYSKGRGWLIQNNNLGVIGDRLGNLTHLPLRYRHIPHWLSKVYCHTQFSEKLRGLFFHSALVHDSQRIHRVAAQKQIIYYISFQTLVQLLMNHGNAILKSILRSGKAYFLTIEENIAFILLIRTKKALHHGRFSGAVFTHKAHNRPPAHIQVNVVQNPVPAKGFTHSPYR